MVLDVVAYIMSEFSDIEEQFGCQISAWSMELVNYDRFVEGFLVSFPCDETMGGLMVDSIRSEYVEDDESAIVDVDLTNEYLGVVVEGDDEADIRDAAYMLHSKIDRPVNWRSRN